MPRACTNGRQQMVYGIEPKVKDTWEDLGRAGRPKVRLMQRVRNCKRDNWRAPSVLTCLPKVVGSPANRSAQGSWGENKGGNVCHTTSIHFHCKSEHASIVGQNVTASFQIRTCSTLLSNNLCNWHKQRWRTQASMHEVLGTCKTKHAGAQSNQPK
jgi:hypothetical protein